MQKMLEDSRARKVVPKPPDRARQLFETSSSSLTSLLRPVEKRYELFKVKHIRVMTQAITKSRRQRTLLCNKRNDKSFQVVLLFLLGDENESRPISKSGQYRQHNPTFMIGYIKF